MPRARLSLHRPQRRSLQRVAGLRARRSLHARGRTLPLAPRRRLQTLRWLQSVLTASAFIGCASAAAAQDDLDDILGGFEDEDPTFEIEARDAPDAGSDGEPTWWDLSGSLEMSGSGCGARLRMRGCSCRW